MAHGFSGPVCGVIFRARRPATAGMALGGIDTGCIDLETSGLLGRCTIFNSLVPRRGPLNSPFLGLSVGGQTWVLCDPTQIKQPDKDALKAGLAGLTEVRLDGVKTAREIHYWGHYPVADLEYETDAPVSVGLRAWAPFLPGYTEDSLIPGIVFEVHLRNTGKSARNGTVAFSFPGPTPDEAGTKQFSRKEVTGGFTGVEVSGKLASYALGVIGKEPARIGGEMGANAAAWAEMAGTLPTASPSQSGSSAAVDFSLQPRENKVVRFAVTWHAPTWRGRGYNWSDQEGDTSDRLWWPRRNHTFTHKYAAHYRSADATARLVAQRHEDLLRRVLAWQEAIYSDKTLPGWLQDCLVNSLYVITEDSLWGQAKPPIGSWCRPEDGIFAMSLSPRTMPFMECIPCSFYGNIPLVYFFPDAALSTLRAWKAYQYPDGRPAFLFGFRCEIAEPEPIFQQVMNGSCLVEIIDKMWLRTGSDVLLREFYESAKKATVYTMNLRPEYGIRQVVSMPTDNAGTEWFDGPPWYGMVPHIGGVHLAHLHMMRRMAERMGDADFVRQCDRWRAGGSQVLEDELWVGDHYVIYSEPETGRKSDSCYVFGHQLDGEWMARFHGLPGAFRPDRVRKTLDTLARSNAGETLSPYGAMVFARWDGYKAASASDYPCSYWDGGAHTPSTMMLAMTYIYVGDRWREFGVNLLRRMMNNLVNRKGVVWDMPNLCRADTGDVMASADDYLIMMLWSVPAALKRQDLAGPCRPGGLVDRVISAAKPALCGPGSAGLRRERGGTR